MATIDDVLQAGLAHHSAGRLSEAESLYRQVLAADPAHAGALHLLGVVALQAGRPQDAIGLLRQAIQRNPTQSVFYSNLGEAHRALGQLADARLAYEQAIRLDPGFPEAHNNLALTLQTEGEVAAAQRCFEQALALRPDYAAARQNLALLLLLRGDYARGWREYSWRECMTGHLGKAIGLADWDGSACGDRRLLVVAEQGLGDTLQFIRYVQLVRQRASKLIVCVPGALVPILTSSGYTEVVPLSLPLPEADLRCSLGSLPSLLMGGAAPFAPGEPYLKADKELVRCWRQKLAGPSGCKVGIAWQGNPAFPSDHFRSVPLSNFEPLAAIEGVRLISLQKGFGVEQIQQIAGRFELIELENLDARDAFMDTAAVMQSLDLVITSDTSVAHLAGGLGVKTWVALALSPDWRWELGRTDSPWYPSMRLFRQTRLGQWQDVFQRIGEALVEMTRR